jgi:hypothetical protein
MIAVPPFLVWPQLLFPILLFHFVPALLGRWSSHASPMQVIPDLTIEGTRLILPEAGDYL